MSMVVMVIIKREDLNSRDITQNSRLTNKEDNKDKVNSNNRLEVDQDRAQQEFPLLVNNLLQSHLWLNSKPYKSRLNFLSWEIPLELI